MAKQPAKDSLATRIRKGVGVLTGHYHAVTDTGKRQAPRSIVRREDEELTAFQRRQLVATATDQRRNAALFAWMVNMHLDYVSRFTFQLRSDNEAVNKRAEELMKWWSRADKCDVARRHSLQAHTRLLEGHAVVEGDAAWLKVQGGRIQGIEGSRIATDGMQGVEYGTREKANIDHGIHFDPATDAAIEYCLGYRNKTQLRFGGWYSADDVIFHGYYTRFDQRRGISPASSAINTIADIYEGMDAMLIKTKMAAMFGLAIMGERATKDHDYVDENGNPVTTATDVIDLGFQLLPGLKLALPSDARIDTIESKTPHQGYLDWTNLCVQVAMLAFDIPVTFYDSRRSSFSARMADVQRYESACVRKRDALRQCLTAVAAWKLDQWSRTPDLFSDGMMLPLPDGALIRDLKWEWQPAGMPWIDYVKERNGDLIGLLSGMADPYKMVGKRGEDLSENIRNAGRFYRECAENGVPIVELMKAGAVGLADIFDPGNNSDDEGNDDAGN